MAVTLLLRHRPVPLKRFRAPIGSPGGTREGRGERGACRAIRQPSVRSNLTPPLRNSFPSGKRSPAPAVVPRSSGFTRRPESNVRPAMSRGGFAPPRQEPGRSCRARGKCSQQRQHLAGCWHVSPDHTRPLGEPPRPLSALAVSAVGVGVPPSGDPGSRTGSPWLPRRGREGA